MKRESIFTVQIKTWIRPYHLTLNVKARDNEHAARITRSLCKFGMIDSVDFACEDVEEGWVD